MKLLLLSAVCFLLTKSIYATSTMLVPSQLKAHPIGKYLSVIQNDAVKLNGDIINRLETSPLQHPPSDYPNLGPTTKRYWGKVSFRNPSPNRKDIYLEYKYPAYTLEIYGDKNYRQPLFSYSERKTENPMNHRFPLFRLTLEPGLNDYYFSLTSSSAAFSVPCITSMPWIWSGRRT